MAIDNAVNALATSAATTLEVVVKHGPDYGSMNFVNRIISGVSDMFAGNIARGGKAVASGMVPVIGAAAVAGGAVLAFHQVRIAHLRAKVTRTALALEGERWHGTKDDEPVSGVILGLFTDATGATLWLVEEAPGILLFVPDEAFRQGRLECIGPVEEYLSSSEMLEAYERKRGERDKEEALSLLHARMMRALATRAEAPATDADARVKRAEEAARRACATAEQKLALNETLLSQLREMLKSDSSALAEAREEARATLEELERVEAERDELRKEVEELGKELGELEAAVHAA